MSLKRSSITPILALSMRIVCTRFATSTTSYPLRVNQYFVSSLVAIDEATSNQRLTSASSKPTSPAFTT